MQSKIKKEKPLKKAEKTEKPEKPEKVAKNAKAAKAAKPVKTEKVVKEVKPPRKTRDEMIIEEEEKLDRIDEEELEQEEQEEEQRTGLDVEALAALAKKTETKQQKQEKVKKILDFKFRSLELIQIFLKKTKNPALFLKYVAPLVVTLRDNQKDKAKDALVNKISVLLKSYINRQHSFGLTYSAELEECVQEILFTARKVTATKVKHLLKYILKIFLAIVFKTELKKPIPGLTNLYKEALEAYITKNSVELDSGYFKELITKYKIIGVELYELLIKGSNMKPEAGTKTEARREECLNMLTSLVQSSTGSSEYLLAKMVQHQNELTDLLNNVFENIDKAKNKNFISLQKYYNLYKLIIKLLTQVHAQKEGDSVLKQKAGALAGLLKKRIVKKLKEVEDKEFIKSNKKNLEKVEAMREEVEKLE